MRGFTEALRIEMLQDGVPVGVTVAHPGGVKTNITNNAMASARASGVELSAADVKRARDYEQRFLRLSPDAAAKTILDGVAAAQPRVLVGNDAKAIDKLVRLIPKLYPRIVARVTPSRSAR
ncbi:Putative oxidoreductase SadH [Baekduia alba]|uniref:hypothetical protein n=1 Tax=Baekduia alba TaxID=2997333 RepID=UPI00233FB248|nr:hypothetical protein [Baekduia alba]WCB93122.1 Putative oxidoreductase SadH [Baekduia alba]